MIIGVDIGGTKTLISVFTESGKLLNEVRLATNHNYVRFLQELSAQARILETSKAKIACIAVPGRIDRKSGVVKRLGNLPWRDKPIRDDIAKALNISSVFIENDSKLAGLGESRALKNNYERVYYITLSTGIGGTLLVNRRIAQEVIDGEVGMVPFLHDGKMTKWEDFASGRAFFEKYGQKAADVEDPVIWEEFSQYIGPGIAMICCIYQVEAIIFGGGLGQHLEKYARFLSPFINGLPDTITKPQELVKAHYADESVIYGCYSYAKDPLV